MNSLKKELRKAHDQLLTSGQVAKICRVNIRTVNRWADRGLLKAINLPGRGDRRVELKDLLAFMDQNQMPIPDSLASLRGETASVNRLLIVDNEKSITSSIGRVLRDLGEIEVANDGFKAGFLLRSFSPHLITLDLHMPGCDGFEVLRVISEQSKKGFKKPKVLVISGLGAEQLERAKAEGADAVLEKPFSNETLRKEVDRLLTH